MFEKNCKQSQKIGWKNSGDYYINRHKGRSYDVQKNKYGFPKFLHGWTEKIYRCQRR